jgi:glucose-6-phosphate 1-dehydrogenase
MCAPPVILYFALPPGGHRRGGQALTDVPLPEGTGLLMEKPFRSDAASAGALNNDLLTWLVPRTASTASTTSWACRPC